MIARSIQNNQLVEFFLDLIIQDKETYIIKDTSIFYIRPVKINGKDAYRIVVFISVPRSKEMKRAKALFEKEILPKIKNEIDPDVIKTIIDEILIKDHKILCTNIVLLGSI